MRKCLGVLAAVAALCMVGWAQAPPSAPTPAPPSAPAPGPTPGQAPDSTLPSAPTPQDTSSNSVPANRPAVPNFPRFEWFGGYSYGQMGLFNAGHWAGLNGWNASWAVNAVSWLGLVVEGSEYFGTSKLPTAAPAPFPPCLPFCPQTTPTFNVKTREYNILFGAQFPWHKYANWTPFGEVMYGHGGVRGEASALGLDEIETSSGRALLAGAGADHRISERFAFRVKADYLQTGTSFPTLGKKKQDNFRVSVGLVIRSVRKKKRRLEDETEPEP